MPRHKTRRKFWPRYSPNSGKKPETLTKWNSPKHKDAQVFLFYDGKKVNSIKVLIRNSKGIALL